MMTNLLLAFISAIGVFLIVIAPQWARARQNLRRVDALRSKPDDAAGVVEEQSFVRSLRRSGLEVAISQADLPVTPAGFVRFGAILALATFALTYVMTGGLLVSAFVTFGSIVLYVYWLHWRRDEKRLEYEEALGDMCDRIAAGAMLTSTLQGAMIHAAEVAPEILKEDVNYIAGQLSQTASVSSAFKDILRNRRSYALELMANTLEVWSMRGATMPLQQVLQPLSTTIREVASERRRMASELSGVRRQMMIVAVAPVFFVALLRFSSPALARIYASPTGELLQIVAYVISALGFLIGQRVLQGVQKILEVEPE